MKKNHKTAWRNISCTLFCTFIVSISSAQNTAKSVEQKGDPARWYQADSTSHDYFETLKKEAQAVFQESKNKCNAMQTDARSSCLKEANLQLAKDMAVAKKQTLEQHE